RAVLRAVETTGRLPATLGRRGSRVGINHLHRAFAGTVLDGATRRPADTRFEALAPWPEVAPKLGFRYIEQADSVAPDLEIGSLYRDGKARDVDPQARLSHGECVRVGGEVDAGIASLDARERLIVPERMTGRREPERGQSRDVGLRE